MLRFYWKQTAYSVLFVAFAFSASAQNTYNNVKPFTGSKEFRKFSVGINAGVTSPSIAFGGTNNFTKPLISYGYGANARYQFNHYFALQADFMGGELKGNNDNPLGNGQPAVRDVKTFKTKVNYSGSINGQLTFGNINFLREKNTVVPYVSVGLGLIGYSPKISTTGNDPNTPYDNVENKKELFAPVGAGLRIDLSTLLNLDLGYRMNFVDGDNFDGASYWTANNNGSLTHKDKFSYGFVGLEFSIGKKAKQKLLFDNPAVRTNNNLQTQIDTVKSVIDALKTDTDGDGVADLFDKEPNTPANTPVDSHGVTRDTDGDGVPDSRDKQLITPTECQPVDADGVGKCPEPACCTELRDSLKNMTIAPPCPTDYPSLSLKKASLNADAKAMLATVAAKLKDKPTCTITITAYPGTSKPQQSLADKKLEVIKNFLVEQQGISADRITTDKNVGGGDENVIDIK